MDFDILLQRTILSGSEYDALIPKTLCKGTSIGNGDTDFSLRKMKEVIEKFNFQTEKIAHKFQKPTIEATVAAIKYFVYNHFQYRADTDVQFIRTPSCSWYQRHSGIDCKSYSIVASSILSNLGIPHALRKIKQPGYNPTSWTHVYVVIPDATNDDNYYVIDGTLLEDEEPLFTEFKDLQIMKHEILNGAVGGLNGASIEQVYKAIGYAEAAAGTGIKSDKLLNIKNMRGHNIADKVWNIIKYVNSAFTASEVKLAIDRMQAHYENLAIRINDAMSKRDMVAMAKAIAEFKVCGKMFMDAYAQKNSEKNWNGETRANINAAVNVLAFYNSVGIVALNAWLNEYFVQGQTTGVIKINSNDYLGYDFFDFSYLGSPVVADMPVVLYSVKPLTYEVKMFVLTKYLGDVANSASVDTQKYLSQIQQVAAIFQNPNSQNQNGTINPATGQPYPNDIQQLPPAIPQKAGMNVLGLLLIGGAVVYGVKEFSKENKTKQSK